MVAPCSAANTDPLARTPGFVDRYLPALLNQAAHLMVGDFADVVKDYGLSIVEWRVLSTLADSGLIPVGLLARRAVTKQSTLTRLLDRMAEQGHIRRVTAETDRRLTLIAITPDGRAVVDELIVKAEAQQKRVLDSLLPGQQAALSQLLKEVIERLAPEPFKAPEGKSL